jgi:dTDP-4-dehydrorhamnose reductase
MKILLTGKTGQIGSKLLRSLSQHEVMAFDRTQMDMAKPLMLEHILEYVRPEIIINAAAYTDVDKAESEKNLAYAINADALFVLGRYASQNACKVYHYSSNYVFDGKLDRTYLETDNPNPVNVYGASKLAGEQALIESACEYCIFRTSWVYSDIGDNFIQTILKLLPLKERIEVVDDQFGAPTSARFIVEMTIKAMEANVPSGIYHLTNTGTTSWYDLARSIAPPEFVNKIQ